jgi:hypothetical protein
VTFYRFAKSQSNLKPGKLRLNPKTGKGDVTTKIRYTFEKKTAIKPSKKHNKKKF